MWNFYVQDWVSQQITDIILPLKKCYISGKGDYFRPAMLLPYMDNFKKAFGTKHD